MAIWLTIGFGVAGFLLVLDSTTYPKNALSPVFILLNLWIWPFTVMALLSVLLEELE